MEDMVDGEVSQPGPAALLGSNGAATGTFTQFEDIAEQDDQKRANDLAIRHGVFNLVSTIVGGGLLSLPYAFAQCGVGLGVVLLALTAGLSVYTVQLLVRCSILSG